MVQQNDQITNLNDYARDNLETDEQGKYACPFCGSGTKKNKTSALEILPNGKGWKCHSCSRGGGIFHFKYYLEHPNDTEVPEEYQLKSHTPKSKKKDKKQATPQQIENCKEYIKLAQEMLASDSDKMQPAYAYLRARGYSIEQAQMLGIGFDPFPNTDNNTLNAPALVIPYQGTDGYYILRNIDPKAKKRYSKPNKEIYQGEEPVFNESAFDTAECIVLVEGAFDMLAIKTLNISNIDIIPIIGAGGHKHVLNALKSRLDNDKTKRPPAICLMLDNDETGRDKQAEIAEKLNKMCVPNVEVDTSYIFNDLNRLCKDADEMRLVSPSALREIVEQARNNITTNYDEMREQLLQERANKLLEETGTISSNYTLTQIKNFQGIEPPIPTGFEFFDKITHGGLHNELTVLCAGSSVGKTTLAVQIADNIAKSGTPVLFVTVEQSRRECIAKSLSRMSYYMGDKKNKGISPLSTTEINYLDVESETDAETRRNTISIVTEEYQRTIAPNLYYMQPNKQPNVNKILEVVDVMNKANNRPPVVFIDYLQLLAPANEYETDKRQTTDNSVTILRQLARDYHTPVFIISSINRESYWQGVSLDSAKESGGIEYSADLLLGLQPYDLSKLIDDYLITTKQKSYHDAMTYKKASKNVFNTYKNKTIKDASLLILKNRNGHTTDERYGIRLENNSLYNSFCCGYNEQP